MIWFDAFKIAERHAPPANSANPANPTPKDPPKGGQISRLARLASPHADLQKELMRAAMHACDCWGDGEAARQAMRQDILAAKPEDYAELLEMFIDQYGPPPSHAAAQCFDLMEVQS